MMPKNQEELREERASLWRLFYLAAGLTVLAGMVLLALALAVSPQTPAGAQMGQVLFSLLPMEAGSLPWYITRAAALTAFLLLWLSTLWGLAMASRLFDPWLSGLSAYDLHETISLLALIFAGLHAAALLFDQYTPFSLNDILLPFTAAYRPEWVGLGSLALYVMAAVTLTAYLRRVIGARLSRLIHLAGLALFWVAAIHGLLTGSDSSLPLAQVMYAGTALSVVFMTTYWLAVRLQKKPRPVAAAAK